jgi:hypothetical protein
MELTPDAWMKLLFTYGPFGLLVFFVFVTESKARSAMQGADKKSKVPLIGIYVCNWAAIFALLGFAVYAWNALNLHKQPSIKGTIAVLERDENVFFDTNENMYLRRADNPGDGSFRYDYLCYLQSNASPIPFVFSRGRDKKATHHEIPVRPEFLGDQARIDIRYSRDSDKLLLEYVNKGSRQQVELPTIGESSVPAPPSRFGWWIQTVSAQSTFSAQTMSRRLESENPSVRRAAQEDLAKQGAAALPYIDKILREPASSDNLQFGAIAALNRMTSVNFASLSPEAWATIQRAARDPREMLQAEARAFLAKNRSAALPATRKKSR